MERTKGSISVLLGLTITIILSFCLVLIESAREKTVLLKAEIVFGACINSVMAEYHKELWETYDVFYVDAAYQTATPSYELVKNRLQYYAEENLKYDGSNWLSLSYQEANMTDVILATDNFGFDFFQKAVDAAKFSNGISTMEAVLSYFNTIEEYFEFGTELSQMQSDITNQIEEANGTEVVVEEAVWGEDKDGNPIVVKEAKKEVVEIENPLEDMESGNFLLKTIVGEDTVLSQKRVNISTASSNRSLAVGNFQKTDTESALTDKALYCTYIVQHFGNYLNPLENTPLSYEMEYIISGKESDIQNLEALVMRLILLREVDNYFTLLSDETKKLEAHAIAAATANIATWLEPIVYQAILIYWAYEMSVEELQCLFAGGEMPLCKVLFGKEWNLDYQEYLCLLLMLEQRETLTMRTIDVIEFFIRQKEEYFQMDACIGIAALEGTFQDAYKKHYMITKTLQYY